MIQARNKASLSRLTGALCMLESKPCKVLPTATRAMARNSQHLAEGGRERKRKRKKERERETLQDFGGGKF